MGGKVVFIAHSIFALIIAATYTGAVAAFLISSSGMLAPGRSSFAHVMSVHVLCSPSFYLHLSFSLHFLSPGLEAVTGFDSLATGKFGVALRGPSFDSSLPEPPFLGSSLCVAGIQSMALPKMERELDDQGTDHDCILTCTRISGSHNGGTASNQTTSSTQFMIMQSLMKSSSTTTFSMYTYERMNTRTAAGNDWVYESACATAERPDIAYSCLCWVESTVQPGCCGRHVRCFLRHSRPLDRPASYNRMRACHCLTIHAPTYPLQRQPAHATIRPTNWVLMMRFCAVKVRILMCTPTCCSMSPLWLAMALLHLSLCLQILIFDLGSPFPDGDGVSPTAVGAKNCYCAAHGCI